MGKVFNLIFNRYTAGAAVLSVLLMTGTAAIAAPEEYGKAVKDLAQSSSLKEVAWNTAALGWTGISSGAGPLTGGALDKTLEFGTDVWNEHIIG